MSTPATQLAWPMRAAASASEVAGAASAPGIAAASRAACARSAAVPPGSTHACPLAEAAALIGHASCVAGVDTGLTHLAVALGRPTVGIYCATRPELTGLHGGDGVNLGGPGKPPSVEAVAAALGYAPAEGGIAPPA